VTADDEKIRELTEIIHAVRDRVRTRYPEPEDADPGETSARPPAVRVPVADLMRWCMPATPRRRRSRPSAA